MQEKLGRKYRAHSLGGPVEDVIISSHGWRSKSDCRKINVMSQLFKGIEIHFLQPDTSLLNIGIQHVIAGKMIPVQIVNDKNPICFDYMLRKWQGARHGGDVESYATVEDSLQSQARGVPSYALKHKINDLRAFSRGDLTIEEKVNRVGDTVQRDVITIRSGGRHKQQQVWLSDLIRTARKAKPHYRVFVCSFCRQVVN